GPQARRGGRPAVTIPAARRGRGASSPPPAAVTSGGRAFRVEQAVIQRLQVALVWLGPNLTPSNTPSGGPMAGERGASAPGFPPPQDLGNRGLTPPRSPRESAPRRGLRRSIPTYQDAGRRPYALKKASRSALTSSFRVEQRPCGAPG